MHEKIKTAGAATENKVRQVQRHSMGKHSGSSQSKEKGVDALTIFFCTLWGHSVSGVWEGWVSSLIQVLWENISPSRAGLSFCSTDSSSSL